MEGEVRFDGDSGDFNLVPVGESSLNCKTQLLAGLCVLSLLPFLDIAPVSILVLRSGEDVLRDGDSDKPTGLLTALPPGEPDTEALPVRIFELELSEEELRCDADDVLRWVLGLSVRCSLFNLLIASLLALSSVERFLK